MTYGFSNVEEKEDNTALSCPMGQHSVRAHIMHVKPTKKHPNGLIPRRAHCAKNRAKKTNSTNVPSKKDILSFEEIICISEAFHVLVSGQKLKALTEFKSSEKYDILILGWVQYWNEIFKLTDAKLKRQSEWEEVIADYKGYLSEMLSGANPNPKGMSDLKSYYARLSS